MHQQVIAKVRSTLASKSKDEELQKLIDAKTEVHATYQPIFQPNQLQNLTSETFRDFLLFRNNRHWSGLHRLGPAVTRDMDALRDALKVLVDESIPIAKRLNALFPKGKTRVKALGKAIMTPILMISSPDKYGVWNGTSEGALRQLGIWPNFERGTSIGERYETVNNLMLEIAAELNVDLWTLDALWWRVLGPMDAPDEELDSEEELDEATGQQFGLERHLHDFLLDNWDKTELAEEWALDEDGGDIKGYGYERTTPIGRIDLLAKHRSEPRWLVIELKRSQSSDDTLGQVQRYMGWVMEELAEQDDQVEGMIVAAEQTDKLRFALKATQNISFKRYEVDFRLI